MSIATAEISEFGIGELAVSERAGFRLCIIRQSFSTVAPEILRQFDDRIPQPLDIRLVEIGDNGGWHFENYRSWPAIWKDITDYDPDCILTINRLGSSFDTPLTLLCELWRIPMVQFYVDHPESAFLPDYECEMDCLLPLVNSRDFLKAMTDRGHRVRFLPMATDAERFRPPETEHRLYPIVFIGDLGVSRSNLLASHVKAKMGGVAGLFTPELNAYIGEAGSWLMEAREKTVIEYFAEHQRGFIGSLIQSDREVKGQMISLVDLQATFLMRKKAIELLAPYHIHVWGGEDWRQIVAPEFFHGRIAYPEIHRLYQKAMLVLNISKFQSMGVADQRHFDVPMCGAALLTEDHPGQREFFDDSEMLYWKDLDHLVELVEAYHDQPEACREIADAAREKILGRHTYETRVGQLIEHVRDHKEWLDSKEPESLKSRPLFEARFKKWIYTWLELGDVEFAMTVIGKVGAQDRTSPLCPILIRTALIYTGCSDIDDPEFLSEYRDQPDFHFMRTLKELKRGNRGAARAWLHRAIKLAPESKRFKRIEEILNAGSDE